MEVKKLNAKHIEINDDGVADFSRLDAEIRRISIDYLNDALKDIGFIISFDGINAVSENYIEDSYSLLMKNSEILDGMIDAAFTWKEERPAKLRALLVNAIAEIDRISSL